jgi:LPS export ABC transporter protein LptC
MPVRLRNFLLSIALIAAALGSWLLRPADTTEAIDADTHAAERGFYILDAIFSGLDEHGTVVYRLAATRIEGSESSDQMQFQDVEISYRQEQDFPWRITAASARRPANTDTLELTDVVIESTADSPGQVTRIEAESLQLETQRQLAVTPGPVRFVIGESSLNAVGLTADLRNDRISLSSGAGGRVSR